MRKPALVAKQVLQDLQSALDALREERAQIDAQIAQLEAMAEQLQGTEEASDAEPRSKRGTGSRRPRKAQ